MLGNSTMTAPVAILMTKGSEHCCAVLDEFGVAWSDNLTPGTKVVIAAADREAEAEARTVLPVLAVPMEASVDALRAASELPVATLAIGKPGAINAALLAVAILANGDAELRAKLHDFRARQTAAVLAVEL